ncbi:MAG TPA: S9 family peptidase [Streptosporangiaceae bacterium]|nr:S9 family peptidase [Streptosporangiaceae bacterium]
MSQFRDLTDYVAIPAVTSLRLAPDGSWLAAAVQALGPEPGKFGTSIWRVDPLGGQAARLTRSAEGESAPEFLPDGSLLFVSKRQEPGQKKKDITDETAKPALWLLPPGGGEARRIAAPPGGVDSVAAARAAQRFLTAAAAFEGTVGTDEDAGRRKARADAGVNAILHESGPVRFWDHDLGPDSLRLHVGHAAAGEEGGGELRDLTQDCGRALDEQPFCLSPDGTTAVTGWRVPEPAGENRDELLVIDIETGKHRTLLGASGADFGSPAVSEDGTQVVAIRWEHDTYATPGDVTLVVVPLEGDNAGPRDLLAGFDRQPLSAAWAPDGQSVYFTADDNGRRPIFAVSTSTGEVVSVTRDDAAYDCLCPDPDGRALYALRATISEPPTPVRIDLTVPAADPVRLQAPGLPLEVPGRVEEVSATAADGARIRGWLVLPDGASEESKAPLLLWVHGGPVMSWNAWSWRWNPWLMAARGYSVLLPDPALSTGYGQDFIARGHANWGDKPFTDVMTITDAVLARPDIDADRTAMMGGSFGGYMANWIAGHTTRFRAIVSHAGLWALDQMFGTTDGPAFWRRIFGHPVLQPERYLASSPHLHADSIATPLLIIHGDRDYRVPVGEALRMWADLSQHGKHAKFLYFPDENHWILKPGDVRVWYGTIFAFLAEHVLGEEWQRPELL